MPDDLMDLSPPQLDNLHQGYEVLTKPVETSTRRERI